jgi:uncharacterized cupin superfamily protein
MSFSSAARRSLSAAGSKVVREQLQLGAERTEIDVGCVGGHDTEASGRRIAAVVNINDADFDEPRDQPGFVARRARIGRQSGAERLGLSLWEVEPGEAAYPYHAHLGEEEMVVLLEGRPSLRTPEGWRELEPGDVVTFLRGEPGAHQIVNRGDSLVRFLAISTSNTPDIVLYPDSGKVGAFERNPDGSGLRLMFRSDDNRDYYDGETPPDA